MTAAEVLEDARAKLLAGTFTIDDLRRLHATLPPLTPAEHAQWVESLRP